MEENVPPLPQKVLTVPEFAKLMRISRSIRIPVSAVERLLESAH